MPKDIKEVKMVQVAIKAYKLSKGPLPRYQGKEQGAKAEEEMQKTYYAS